MKTMEDFDDPVEGFFTIYGHSVRETIRKRTEAFARLYARSGWTIAALAEEEKLSTARITQMVTYGKFLLATSEEYHAPCSEKTFRALWTRTDKRASEAVRYAAVMQMLQDGRQERSAR